MAIALCYTSDAAIVVVRSGIRPLHCFIASASHQHVVADMHLRQAAELKSDWFLAPNHDSRGCAKAGRHLTCRNHDHL